MKLQISYYKDTDTLSIWNGQTAWSADDVAQNLIMDLDSSGSPVGLTLEHAAELLLPSMAAMAPAQEGKRGVSGKSHPLTAEISDRREDIKLEIKYHAGADVLWLGNGLPTPNGEDIAEYVTAFFDDDDRPNAVMIEDAAEILLPILQAAVEAKQEEVEQPEESAKAANAS